MEDPRQQGESPLSAGGNFSAGSVRCDIRRRRLDVYPIYGQKKLEFLRRFLPFENGTPSHDQLGILFSRLDMEQFQSCFISWVASLNETLEGVVAVDGKTLRRSFDTNSNQSAIHMVSWACPKTRYRTT